MSDLNFTEKRNLEKLFDMSSGYVLNFSNRTLQEFVADSTGRNIYDSSYDQGSGSKANRLRAFWSKEPNHVVGKLVSDLLEYCRPVPGEDAAREHLHVQCQRIAARLTQSVPIDSLDAVEPVSNEAGFEILAREVRNCIERNQPEAGLDRLHTYVTKLVRTFAEARGVQVDKDKPLHSVFGEYVKRLNGSRLIESEMTERILKTSISILESFNRVRNNHSLSHDNPTLNYEESLLIFNHVCSAIRFIRALENCASRMPPTDSVGTPESDIPF